MQERVDAIRIVEAGIQGERKFGQAFQGDGLADPAAQEGSRAPKARDKFGGVRAAERHHESGGAAKVGTDPNLGDGDRHAVESGIFRLAAVQDMG